MARSKQQGKKRKIQKAGNVTQRSKPPEAASPRMTTTRTPSKVPPPSSPPPTVPPPVKSRWRQIVVRWIINKFRKTSVTRPTKLQPASERLKLWMVGTVHWTALVIVIVVAVFCMKLLVSPEISLNVRLGAAGILGYIIRKFVLFLTRMTL